MLATLLLTLAVGQTPADEAAAALALAQAARSRPAPAPKVVEPVTPAVAQKVNKPTANLPLAAETSTEWVVTLDGRTFHVPQPETRESAIRLAKLAAGVTEAKATAPGCSCGIDCQCAACDGKCAVAATKPEPPSFTPLPLTQWYSAPAYSTCPNGQCPTAAGTIRRR